MAGTASSVSGGISSNITRWYAKLRKLESLSVQVHEESGAVTAQAIKRMAYMKTPRRTGEAQGSWVVISGRGRQSIVNTAPHWQFIRQGTGKYGPSGQLILPKGARVGKATFYTREGKVLSFIKEGETKFKKWSRGMRPRDPMGMVNTSPPIEDGKRYVRDRLGRFMTTR